MLPTEVRKLPADCSEARAELNTSASFLSSELALTFLHHNPHLPRNRWGIPGWWWGMCEREKTVDSTPFFRWMLQQKKKKKKTVHDDEDMDKLSLELLLKERKKEIVKNCGSRYLNQYLGKSILDILNPITVWGRSQYRRSCAEIRSIYRLPRFAQLVHCCLHWLCWMPSPCLQDLSPYSSLSLFVCLSQSITCIMEQTLYMGDTEIAQFHSFHKGFGALRFPLFHKSLGGKKKNAKNPARIIVYVVLLGEFCKLLWSF